MSVFLLCACASVVCSWVSGFAAGRIYERFIGGPLATAIAKLAEVDR